MAEIKISELSVGDWVQVCDTYFNGDVFRVTAIIGNGYVNADRENKAIFKYDINRISPIPLTAEILEKNGLCVVEEDADFSEYELFGSENFSIFHTKGTLRYRFETPQASVVCWFVHQLQHALRLAGVEKEIEV